MSESTDAMDDLDAALRMIEAGAEVLRSGRAGTAGGIRPVTLELDITPLIVH